MSTKFQDATGFKPMPVGSNERIIELRISDMSTKAFHCYSVKTNHGEMMSDPDKVKRQVIEAFIKLVDTLFKPRPPEVNTLVVDKKENDKV